MRGYNGRARDAHFDRELDEYLEIEDDYYDYEDADEEEEDEDD